MKKIITSALVQSILAAIWALLLLGSDAFSFVFLLTGIASIAAIAANCIYKYRSAPVGKRHIPTILITSIILSGAVLIANYGLMGHYTSSKPLLITGVILIFAGGICVFANIIQFLVLHTSDRLKKNSVLIGKLHRFSNRTVLLFSAAVFIIIYTTIFILGYFPGILSPDSINQIDQTFTGIYSNHHPFWHTLIIQLCLRAGTAIWGSTNAGVCIYSILQIICMSFSFGYAVMALYDLKLSYRILIPVVIYFTLMPYHIMYSFTMWKDVLFGAAAVVFITSLFRLLHGRRLSDHVLLIISSFGICLLRSNGQIAFAVTFIAAIFVLGKKYIRVILIMAAVLVCTVVLKYPVLQALHVTQPDTIESLSIPSQQIARVIADGGELTDEQKKLLENVVDVDRVAETYQWYTSDYIKDLVRERDNQEYISEHKADFIKMYLQIGIRHPSSFIKGWIDATKGYYNSGYGIFNWTVVQKNEHGIERHTLIPAVQKIMDAYTASYNNIWPLQPLVSIGLFVWAVIILAAVGIAGRKRETILTVPCIAMVLTLLIATPIYAEFRYAYALFTCMPVLIGTVIFTEKEI